MLLTVSFSYARPESGLSASAFGSLIKTTGQSLLDARLVEQEDLAPASRRC
jgi:hypothetical protein